MKKNVLALAATTALLVGVSCAYAIVDYTPGAGVKNSPHNMTKVVPGSDGAENRVCAFCHTPHHAMDAAQVMTDYAPLWSHDVTNQSYGAYQSATLNAVINVGDPLVGPSRLCMSCHDGSIAIDQHYGTSFAGTTYRVDGDGFGGIDVGLAGDLSNDHPIGFDYTLVAKGGANVDKEGGVYNGIYPLDKVFTYGVTESGGYSINPSATNDTSNSMLVGTSTVVRTIKDLMYKKSATENFMTCASCHDVHNKDVPSNQHYLLVNKNDQSALCLTCHNK